MHLKRRFLSLKMRRAWRPIQFAILGEILSKRQHSNLERGLKENVTVVPLM